MLASPRPTPRRLMPTERVRATAAASLPVAVDVVTAPVVVVLAVPVR